MNQLDLIFLLEEPSMKEMLEVLLARIIPAEAEITYKCLPHEGKQDLEKSIPRKLKAWNAKVKFIIIRDRDSEDCKELKQRLKKICQQANRDDTLIRIACHELESWFLGDLAAVEQAFKLKKGQLTKLQDKKIYRNPDTIANAKEQLKKLVPDYQPINSSREIAKYLDIEENKSPSFNIFIKGIKKIVSTCPFIQS